MMSSIIDNRFTRTIIVLLMIGTMILPVPLFKNIYITPMTISVAMADSTPPYIVHTPVTKSKAGESVQITATIDDESDINDVSLHYKKENVSDYESVKMNKAEGKDNQFDANIPDTEVVGESLVYFIEARDTFGNISQAGNQSNPFYIKVIGPLPKPNIIHNPITRSGANESIEINAKIESQDIVKTATLYYQMEGESEKENILMALKEGNLYQAIIPADTIKNNRVKYYIAVVDKFDITTVLKDQVGEPFVIEIERKNNGESATEVIADVIKTGSRKWYTWALIVVGVIIAGIAISSSGGGAGGAGGGTSGGAGG